MIVSNIRIATAPHERDKILEILRSVKGPTEVQPGCLGCCIYQDLQNEKTINYEEVWQSEENLENHIRSALYRNILAIIDMSAEPPSITFHTVLNTTGIELIENILGSSR